MSGSIGNNPYRASGVVADLAEGRTGTVDWITTPKVTGDSPVTAATAKGYFLNTTAGTITINLPAGVAGSIVGISDYASTANSNNITVSPNGTDKINAVNDDYTISTKGLAVTLVYVDSTRGWKSVTGSSADATAVSPTYIVATGGNAIVTCGDYKTHIFTGPGSFCVACVASCAPNNVTDWAVVAGGGGTFRLSSAGAGAGGMRFFSTAPGSNSPINNSGASPNCSVTVTASCYPITVGGGGAPGPSGSAGVATVGGNSQFSSIASIGGGRGGTSGQGPGDAAGQAGGSGGGGDYNVGSKAGGSGNTPPETPPQGNDGSPGNCHPTCYASGGGGGAGAAGGPTCPGADGGGDGGSGTYIADPFIGPTAPSYGTPGPVSSTRYFAGGGGGAISITPTGTHPAGDGGVGGGGERPDPDTTGNGGSGVVNTGGGGQGGGPGSSGGGGGSGIVMIRYQYQ